jgi:serine/threonine protein kinase
VNKDVETDLDDESIERSLRALGAEVDEALADQDVRCGPYLLLEEIGEGGYGVVHVAIQDEPVERRVAVKLLKPGLDTRDVVRRFRREQRALAKIDHPCVASILEAGVTADGRPWFAMPLIDGDSITATCQDGRLSLERRLDLMARVCDGVQAAHVQGIVHRDLKPGNVLVTRLPDGTLLPKVIDFGIAKAIDPTLAVDQTVTQAGRAVGTPAYMAPEQFAHEGVTSDLRSDVYALGVLAAELLAGRRPDHGTDPARRVPVLPSRLVDQLSLEESRVLAEERGFDGGESLRRALIGDLDAIVAKATMPEPHRRYQSAEALADDLRRAMRNEPVRARAPGVGYVAARFLRRHRLAATLAALAIVALIGMTLLSVVAARRAMQYSREAQARATQAEQLNGLLRRMVARIDPATTRSRDPAMLLVMLDDAGAGLLRDADQLTPEVLGEMTRTLVDAYDQLDQPGKAVALCRALLPGLQAVAAGNVAHDDQGRTISATRGAAKVALALGDALYRAGAIQAGALPNLADREAPRQAWRNAMHLLETIDESGHPDAIRAAIRLWSVRTGRDPSVPDEHAAATLEMWIVDRVDALPVDDPDRWRFVMRQAELADYESLLKQYPPLLERYAAAMGARHPDVVKARIRNVRFRVGAGLETHLRETKQSGVPFLRGSVLQAHWEQTAELSHAVVQDACQVFGEDHSVTNSARLWDLAAHGHAFGAEAARPRFDRLAEVIRVGESTTSDFQRQLHATWQGITVDPVQGIWWGP